MNKWTEKNILGLKDEGKIRGCHIPRKNKGYSTGTAVVRGSKYDSKALDWLGWNLLYWSNEHAVTLEREYKFCPERAWRFDWAIPSIKISIEFEGGIFMQNSGHNTAKHYNKDSDKYNKAAVLGWRVIRVTAMNYTTVLNSLNEMVK